jgi:hypothetical protein
MICFAPVPIVQIDVMSELAQEQMLYAILANGRLCEPRKPLAIQLANLGIE